jgi:hypothetical protein
MYSTMHYTGTIPSEIGLMTDLTTLSLNENSLSGSIPSEVGQEYSFLRNRAEERLSLTCPSSFSAVVCCWQIGMLTMMQWTLELSENSLTGSIPSQVSCVPVHYFLAQTI